MKEITSKSERSFVNQLTSYNKRLDGREHSDWRAIAVLFGTDRGCCLTHLGNTRVLSQVSCELVVPNSSRPNEGQLHINVDLSPMAAPNFDGSRSSDACVEMAKLLERCIRDARCIDMEALCIVSGEKVWALRVDVHALNHDGNLAECASVAVIASLTHFRRPDVTVLGEDVTVHSTEERDPVPLNVLHMPFCTTHAIFNQGENILCDPTELEERVAEGRVVIGMNSHQEICTLHMSGHVLFTTEKILKCARLASLRIKELTTVARTSLDDDAKSRASGKKVGFAHLLHTNSMLGMKYLPQSCRGELMDDASEEEMGAVGEPVSKPSTLLKNESGIYFLGEGGPNKWETLDMEEEMQKENSEGESSIKQSYQEGSESHEEDDKLEKGKDSSEEEEEIMLQPDMEKEAMQSRHWYNRSLL